MSAGENAVLPGGPCAPAHAFLFCEAFRERGGQWAPMPLSD